jgi:hypothetical protein
MGAIRKDTLVIEANPEPCILAGHVKHLLGKSEETLPELASAFITAN